MTDTTAASNDESTTQLIKAFKIAALAEAISWGALLLAMVVKYSSLDNPMAVKMIGPIHGTMFLAYVALTITVGTKLKWGLRTIVLGLAAAIPPFMTVVFEKWIERSGRLSDASNA